MIGGAAARPGEPPGIDPIGDARVRVPEQARDVDQLGAVLAEERDSMRQTRHKSVVVTRRYIRDGSLFRNNAAATVRL